MAKRTLNLDTKDIQFILEHLPVDSTPLRKKLENNLKTIKVSSRKGKGRGFQQEICQLISELIDIPYNQADEQCEIHSKEMGLRGVDLVFRGEALKRFPFSVECKNCESLDLAKTVTPARDYTIANTHWLIFHRRKSIPEDLVMMSTGTFAYLFRRE